MKISVIVTTILVAQVSASFFDVFHGAVLTVQNSFGKLLSDVVTDVKETVDCTILAVEHVLSLSHDATTRYYDKCSSGTNKTDAVSEAPQESMVPKVEVTLNLPNNNEEYLQKVIPAEIDARINERLSKVLGNYKPHDNVLSIENVLAKESEQLAGVSVLVKKELDKLTNEVTTDLKNIEKQRDSQPSVDTILQEIKVLEEREQNTKNTSEAKEIHQVIDQVLGKLDTIEATEATENVKLEEILRDLEKSSNNSFVDLRHQFEEWKEEEARHLREIKSKMEAHEKLSDNNHGSYKRHESNLIQPVSLNTDMNRDDIDTFSSSSKTSNKNTTLVIEVLDNSTSSRSIADGNDMSIIPFANKSSSLQNKSLEDDGLSDTTITSNTYSTTNSPIGSGATVRSSELPSLFTNQSTTTPNNLTGDDAKLNITDTTLLITFVNESIQSVVSMTDSDKQQTLPKNKTTSILSTDENNSTQSVIRIQTPEITVIEEATLPVKSKTDFGKEESPYSVTKNDTVLAETAMTDMTSIPQNINNTNDLANSSAANPLIENTSVNATGTGSEASSILPSYDLATFDNIQSTDTISTSTSPAINVGTSVNETTILIENSTSTGNVESSTVTTTKVNDDVSYVNKILSTSLPNVENTPIQPIVTTTSSSKEESPTTIVHDKNFKDIVITSTFLSIVENTHILQNIQTEETSTTTNNNTTISGDSSPVVENTTLSQIIEPKETTTASGNKESLNGSIESIIASSSLPIVENTPVSDTIEGNTKVSSNEESKEAATELITSSKIENYSYTTVTKASTLNISSSESETIQAIDNIVSSSEELFSTATKTPNTSYDLNAAVVTGTEQMISERIPEEKVAESDNDVNISSTANSLIASSTTSVDTDSDNVLITSTTFPILEITSAKESIDLETTTPAGNEETHALTKATNESTQTNYTEITNNAIVTETIQTVENKTASEEKDFSSTSTHSPINEIVTTSTALPSTESISESIISSRNESNSPSLEANTFSRTTNIPDMNNVMKDTPFKITEIPPVNREKLTENKFNQDNYNINEASSKSYDYNAPISLIDRSLQPRQPLMNSEVPNRIPINGQQALPPITRGGFNDAQNQADAFAIFDSIDKRLSKSDTPFGPKDDIPIANIPLAPLLPSAPRNPIDPGRNNFENPSFLLPSQPSRSLYVDDRDPGNSYRPQGLTTHKPRNANNYQNPSIDYDSFFHTPPRNSEAHQRAVKEARQIMANSKLSERIINNILKNKSKLNARSIFNG